MEIFNTGRGFDPRIPMDLYTDLKNDVRIIKCLKRWRKIS